MICADIHFVDGFTQTVLWNPIELIHNEVSKMRHTHTFNYNVWARDHHLLTRTMACFLLILLMLVTKFLSITWVSQTSYLPWVYVQLRSSDPKENNMLLINFWKGYLLFSKLMRLQNRHVNLLILWSTEYFSSLNVPIWSTNLVCLCWYSLY